MPISLPLALKLLASTSLLIIALDALAAGGVRFTDAVASVPRALPSHATILTGLDPTRMACATTVNFDSPNPR